MKKILILLSIVLCSLQAGAELKLPPAPEGYQWIKILNGKSALLQPNGWFLKDAHPKDTDAYFVTKEDIDKLGKFSTGLSLNVLYKIDKKTGRPPSEYAQSMVKNMSATGTREVVWSSTDKAGPFVRVMCQVRDKHPEGNSFIHYLFVANDQTGTLWWYFFESPEKEWDDAWGEFGSTMMDFVLVESDI